MKHTKPKQSIPHCGAIMAALPNALSDEDDSGASFDHPIGDVDAVGEPNGVGE